MTETRSSVLDGVERNLSELKRSVELQRRAAGVGFDWDQLPPVLAKIREELTELENEINNGAATSRTRDELGDVLFAVANLARKLRLDPEQALRGTNQKFLRRFGEVEAELAKQGKHPDDATLEEMDALWERAKDREI